MTGEIVELPFGNVWALRELVRHLRPILRASFAPAEADTIMADMEKRVLRICDRATKWELPAEAVITGEQLQKFVAANFLLAVNEILCLEIELHLAQQACMTHAP